MAIENKLLEKVTRSLSLDLPVRDTMDEYLDMIIPLVQPWGEDLYEEEYYLDTRWLEVRDDDTFHESVLHIFREEGEYLHSIDGNIHKGEWRKLDNSNTFIIEQKAGDAVVKSELYDLAFLNKEFFILRKHGDQQRKGFSKYFVMGRESYINNLEWRDVMELLFNRYRNNSRWIIFATVVVLIIAIFVFFSVF
jgi:hypothetical protein